jgi:hypothetical protein
MWSNVKTLLKHFLTLLSLSDMVPIKEENYQGQDFRTYNNREFIKSK